MTALHVNLKRFVERIKHLTKKRFNAAITRIKSMRYIAAICLVILSLLLFPLLFFPFPPGADVGHILALSYTFEGIYVEGPLKHPPVLPFLMFLLYRISFGDIGVILTLTKIFGVAVIFPLGIAFYLLGKQLSKNQLAAKFAFFLAILNPLFLYEILWSGHPQFFGMTFAILSIFWLLKVEEGSKYGGLACAFFASLTIGSHAYTSTFLCVFLLVYSVVQVIRTNKKLATLMNMGKIGVLVALFSTPYFFFYQNILNDLKTTPYPTSFSLFLNSITGEILLSNQILGIEFVVLIIIAILSYVKYCRKLTKSTEVLSTLATSASLLFLFTPPISANRVFYFFMIPAILLFAITLGRIRLPKRLFPNVRNKMHSRRSMWVGSLVLCLVLLTVSTSVIQYFLAIRSFTPLSSDSLEAFEAIRRDSELNDKVLVTSYWPEFDSWWLEGITQCEALERGSVRWFLLQSEVDRVILGKTLLFGTHVVDGGCFKLLDNSPYLANYTHIFMMVSGAGALGIITITDNFTNVVVKPIANSSNIQETVYPLSPGEPEIGSDNSLFVKCAREKWGILEKTLSLNSNLDLALVKYSFESYNYSISNVTLDIASYNEIIFEDMRQNNRVFYVTYRHEWEGITGSFQIAVKNNETVTGQFIKNMDGRSHIFLTFTPSSLNATELDVSLEVKINGVGIDTPTTYSIYKKCEEKQIRYVYIRGESWLRDKFEKDPFFTVFFKKGEVVVYKYIGETTKG